MVEQKDTAIAKQQRRAMAQLLEVCYDLERQCAGVNNTQQGKEESAKIRVENIIRSDITTELLEILELYCELLLARTGLMEAKECDPGLEEAVKSIIYAAPRTEIKELQQARLLLVEKYGKDFATAAMDNTDGKVAERVVKKLRVDPPSPELVHLYLEEIARTYGVAWPKNKAPPEEDEDGDDNPSGGIAERLPEQPLTTEELSKANPPRDLGPKSPVHVAPPSPSTENISPRLKLPGPPDLKPTAKMSALSKQVSASDSTPSKKSESVTKKDPIGGKIPEIDDLAKRFAALKR
jgi:vacuolar protein sorting-associated protein IST1